MNRDKIHYRKIEKTELSQLKTINEVKEKKQLIINEQKPKTKEILESSRKQRKIEMACFWAWPFGHIWQSMGKDYYRYGDCYRVCLGCKKRDVLVDTYYG